MLNDILDSTLFDILFRRLLFLLHLVIFLLRLTLLLRGLYPVHQILLEVYTPNLIFFYYNTHVSINILIVLFLFDHLLKLYAVLMYNILLQLTRIIYARILLLSHAVDLDMVARIYNIYRATCGHQEHLSLVYIVLAHVYVPTFFLYQILLSQTKTCYLTFLPLRLVVEVVF